MWNMEIYVCVCHSFTSALTMGSLVNAFSLVFKIKTDIESKAYDGFLS
jgi:hypothetical protein